MKKCYRWSWLDALITIKSHAEEPLLNNRRGCRAQLEANLPDRSPPLTPMSILLILVLFLHDKRKKSPKQNVVSIILVSICYFFENHFFLFLWSKKGLCLSAGGVHSAHTNLWFKETIHWESNQKGCISAVAAILPTSPPSPIPTYKLKQIVLSSFCCNAVKKKQRFLIVRKKHLAHS